MKPGETFLRKKIKGVFDDRLNCVEIYNRNNFDVLVIRDKRFDNMIISANIPLGPEKAICRPKEFLFLPHQFVTYQAANGSPTIELTTNIGDAIGKGNKEQSLPIFEGKQIIR